MVTTRRQRREEVEKIRREKLWNSMSNDIRKRRTTLLNSIADYSIISEILLRLPVEALSRFKCTSKAWYTLLHESFFIKLYLNRSIVKNNNIAFMIYNLVDLYSVDSEISSSSGMFNKRPVLMERPFISSNPFFSIYGSCNGIFLISMFHTFDRICMWNPSTREYRDLSEQFSITPKYISELYLSEYIGYWVGYDSSMDDYKVIRFASYYNHDKCVISDVHVYSMRTDSCRRIQNIPYSIFGAVSHWYNHCRGGILLCGAIHWLGMNQGSSMSPLRIIVTFDLANEDFKEFQLPDTVLYSKSIRLGEFEDCLCIYSVNKDSYIDMFVMKEYGVKESWTKVFSITDQSVNTMKEFKVLSITNEGKLLVQWNYRDLALYDPNHGGHHCGKIKIQGLSRSISNCFRVETYVKSLVSLGTNTYV